MCFQVWVAPGGGLAEPFTRNIESLAHNSHLSMLAIFGVFALVHSGGAFLRPYGTSPSSDLLFMGLWHCLYMPRPELCGSLLRGADASRA